MILLINAQRNTKPEVKVNPSAHFWSFRCLSLVHSFQYWVHKLQTPWLSQFSKSESALGSVLNPLPYTRYWKLPSGENLGLSEGSPHLFLFSQ